MSNQNLSLGKSGEELAVSLLKENGYKIIERNFRTKIGEIDIVARDKDTISFVEVKLRNSDRFGLPQEALTTFKRRQISKVALTYLKQKNLLDKKARFDVVSIILSKEGSKIDLIKNAFELEGGYVI